MAGMVIDMNETRLCSLEQLKAFTNGSGGSVPSLTRINHKIAIVEPH